MPEKKITRRQFCQYGTAVATSLGLAGNIFLWSASRCTEVTPKSLCLEPTTNDEKVIAAVIDTIVPGKESDPTGAPGALDACAMNFVFDPFYPLAALVPVITALMQTLSRQSYSTDFLSLNLTQRTDVINKAEEATPALTLAFRFIRSIFYTDIYNRIGYDYIGFPGGNIGYIYEDYSFKTPMAQEMTTDGNLP